MTLHLLKCDPAPFQAVVDGRKICEIRLNDRDFKVGDIVGLRETDSTRTYFTGRETHRTILHIQDGYGLEPGHVALSISLEDTGRPIDSDAVEALQRELLAIARGGKHYDSWAKVNGTETTPNLRREIGTLSRINELREKIKAINPDAALYYGWGGHGDQARESKRWNG